MRVNPVIGPDRFNVDGVVQDRPGFAYVIVTQPGDQGAQVGDRFEYTPQCPADRLRGFLFRQVRHLASCTLKPSHELIA
jgi:hypothetical protein